jgi:short-subunit dehydrogenase
MVVVTGASKGIGLAIADIFGSQGFDLAICSRNEKMIQEVGQRISHLYGVKVWAFTTDLSQKQQVLDFAQGLIALNQPIEALINNAGLFLSGTLQTEPDETLEKLFDLNLKSVYYLTSKLLPKFIEQRNGLIVNVASVASLMPFWNCLSYTISKHALLGFSKCLREELKPYGVRVTSLMPGATFSASWDGTGVEPQRLMRAEDVAQIVWSTFNLPANAVVEEIVMRPQLGDL